MISKFPPNEGGTEMHTYTLAKELIKNGHEVFILVPPYEGDFEDIKSLHVIEGKMINIPFLKSISLAVLNEKMIDDLVKRENIDVIHSHSVYCDTILATKIGAKYDIPTYITVHMAGIIDNPNNFLEKIIIRRNLKKIDNVLAVSNDILKELSKSDIKNIKEKTSLHLNAIDINKFKEVSSKTKKEKPVVIYVGWINKRKNVELLIDAKKQSKIDYELILVGNGSESDKLKNRVEKENIKDVTFTGRVKNVEEILPYADLFVLPSQNEGLSIALIEALACGLPVIGSNISGMSQAITPDVGLLFKPNDSSSLKKAIEKILTNEELYNKFKSNARKKAMEFSEMKIPYKELKQK